MDCFRVHHHFLSCNSKTMIKFLFSFSVFSVLCSLLPFVLQSLKPFLAQFFSSYTLDKSYMFLLCNGLMVFIAITSGLINASSKGTANQSAQVPFPDYSYKNSRLDFNAPVAGEIITAVESPQEQENSLMVAEDGEEGNAMVVIDEHEHDHDHGHAAEDTAEELNKKCEDFIRKMKEAFRADKCSYMDNQKSLVLVN